MSESNEIAELRAQIAGLRTNVDALNAAVIKHIASSTAISAALFTTIELHPNPSVLLQLLNQRFEQTRPSFLVDWKPTKVLLTSRNLPSEYGLCA